MSSLDDYAAGDGARWQANNGGNVYPESCRLISSLESVSLRAFPIYLVEIFYRVLDFRRDETLSVGDR